MEIRNVRTPGLGDTTYVVAHEGIGVVVDPQRDLDRFTAELDRLDVELRWVLETHVHNDYVSGGRTLAARRGAELVLPAGSGAAFTHTPAFHHEDLGGERGLTLRPLHTPGHTPEHTSYLLLIDGEPVAAFTGGSLLVGASGRTDLLGPERTEPLARLQHRSLTRLAELPDHVGVHPTHGQGSFCTSGGAGEETSTIGDERRDNPALHQPDADAFVAHATAGLEPWPTYYARMGPINLHGPEGLDQPPTPADLAPGEVAARGADTWLVDARPRDRVAAGHVPDAITVTLEDRFGVWLGWLLPFDAPVQLVVDDDQDVEEAVRQLARIGFDSVEGVLRGVKGWDDEGRELRRFGRAHADDLVARLRAGEDVQVLDVRSPSEVAEAPLPGAVTRYVPDLVDGPPDGLDPARPTWVVCGNGFRSGIAAGLIARHGHRPVVVDESGAAEVLAGLDG